MRTRLLFFCRATLHCSLFATSSLLRFPGLATKSDERELYVSSERSCLHARLFSSSSVLAYGRVGIEWVPKRVGPFRVVVEVSSTPRIGFSTYCSA